MPDQEASLSEWLQSELYRRRTLHFSGPLDDEAAGRLAATLMTMDADGDDAVHLHISSTTGSMDAAMVLIDTIDLLGVPVRATALGAVHGPAAFVVALSPIRAATANASLRLVDPKTSHEGRPQDLVRAAELSQARLDTLRDRLAEVMGKSSEEIASYLRDGRTFTAAEALAAGLVDEIATAPRARGADSS
ncbi:MAG: ATP-dependent Clp protease proteolytic subunit [Actinobacteria bacterium]|nr:ATP-dependent Clp protease proteolytic subunit [Actinomycetota bacterium]